MRADIIIRPDPVYRRRLLDEQRAKSGMGRRRGIHVSDLIFCTRKAWAERTLDFAEDVPDETILLWARGLSHEDLLADGVEQVRAGYCLSDAHADERSRLHPWTPELDAADGACPDCGDTLLIGTIDWVMMESTDGEALDDYVPVEMKSTLKSGRKTLADMPWYADQLLSYMAMHGRQRGRIAILHIMGDYSRDNPDIRGGGPKPQLNVYEVQWRDPSAPENWLAELSERKALVQGDVKPPLDDRSPAHPYICDYCDVGELLPDGTQCERWPWVKQPSGVYTRKGSRVRDASVPDMQVELEEMLKRTLEATDE